MRIGFLINPIAGMGGPLGLGGSDGRTLEDFERLNARAIAPERAMTALKAIIGQPCFKDLEFLTCSGLMGSDVFSSLGIACKIIHRIASNTTRDDTIASCEEFKRNGAELIIFVGGDGTARDICSAIDKEIPIFGIPSGVKMHSSVFINSPIDAGFAIQVFYEIRRVIEAEVMDVDEEEFRAGRVSARLYGSAIVPDISDLMQSRKSPSDRSSEADEIEELAEYFSQSIDDISLYIMGTGSTIAEISKKIGIEKNELTVSAIKARMEIGRSLDESAILDLLGKYDKIAVIVTPIGGQGFVFGRGNQQISSRVIARISNENIMMVATPTKLSKLKALRVDTGDISIDSRLRGYWKVLTGYARYKMMSVQ